MAWRGLIMNRVNHLGTQAYSNIYELARNQGTTFYGAIRLVAENPSILTRQGRLVKTEYEDVHSALSELQMGQEREDDLSDFVDWMYSEFVASEDNEGVSVVVRDVISESGLDSVKDLLHGLTSPIREAEQVRVEGAVNIMTMHQAKGLDADAVFVVAAEDEYIPGRAQGRGIDDERRLLYVSLTRARSFLYVTHCTKRTGGQRHTGRDSGSVNRTLTRFLSGGPISSRPGAEFLRLLSR